MLVLALKKLFVDYKNMPETLSRRPEEEPFITDEFGQNKGNARATYYNAWWMYIVGGNQAAASRPLYSIHVETEEELALAQAVQPSIVDARFYLRGELVEPSTEPSA